MARENIEGWEPADVTDPSNYFYLRVEGDSMINAGICPDDKVLIRRQNTAESGQIVACIVVRGGHPEAVPAPGGLCNPSAGEFRL